MREWICPNQNVDYFWSFGVLLTDADCLRFWSGQILIPLARRHRDAICPDQILVRKVSNPDQKRVLFIAGVEKLLNY